MHSVEPIETIHPGTRATMIARFIHDKIPVETGFIIAAHAFEVFIEHNAIAESLDELLKESDHSSATQVAKIAKTIKAKILRGEFPPDLISSITKMYLSLDSPRVMLTPSFFVDEQDNPLFTQIESYFYGYEGDANLFEGIKEVWSHFFDQKPLFYRLKHGRNHFTLPFSICVQKQPHYKISAIVYTDDPTAHTKQTTLIKAVFGEGALIHAIEGADYYWVKRGTGELYNSLFDTQREKTILANGREHSERVSSTMMERRKLQPATLAKIAKLARDLQQHAFFPQECTIGIDGERCVVIETKQLQTGTMPKAQPQAVPAVRAARPILPSHQLRTGLIHSLAPATHLPAVQVIDGHLLLDPTLILAGYTDDLTRRNVRTLTHELIHALDFVATHTQVHQGLIFWLPTLADSPEKTHALLDAVREIHRIHPALPITLLTAAGTFEAYQRTISLWVHNGLARSSRIHHANLLSTPAQIYRLKDYAQVGMDLSVCDLDALAHAMHGDGAGEQEGDAVLDLVHKYVTHSSELGTGICIRSTRVPTHAMLEAILTSGPVEWLTTITTYSVVASKEIWRK